MNKIIIAILGICCLMSDLQADYQDDWVKAVEYCHQRKFELAEREFTSAINKLETLTDSSKPNIYIDRARLYHLLDKHEEALIDLNKGLSSDKLTNKERVRGLVTRIGVCANLQKDISDDIQEFENIYSDFPTYEVNNKRMVIRNIPDCECFKETISKYMIDSRFCESEKNIQIFSSGIMIIDRMPGNDCGCSKQKNLDILPNAITPQEVQEYIDECRGYCNTFKEGGDLWCVNHFSSSTCRIACLIAVKLIQNWCLGCCSQGNFFKTCIEPYNDIAAQMDSKICKPDWD
jgi:tetratricopeptide (TPR) repeat protein